MIHARPFLTIIAAALFLSLGSSALGQQWNKEQKEVWEFEMSCVDAFNANDLESFLGCLHDDYVGWFGGSSVPLNKADRRAIAAREFQTTQVVFSYVKPLSIQVHGNMATVLSIGTFTLRDKATGKETTVTMRWTDVCLKERGRWTWVADHVSPVKDS